MPFPLQFPFQFGGPPAVIALTARWANPYSIVLDWVPLAQPSPAGYMIACDGQPFATIAHGPPVTCRIPERQSIGTPIWQVVQIPLALASPGYFNPGMFNALPPNKVRFTWKPPASITNVDHYRVYWDLGTGTITFDQAHCLGEIQESVANRVDIGSGVQGYEMYTPPVVTGIYKFIVHAVDALGNESAGVTETSQSITTLPSPVTGIGLAFSNTTHKATLVWQEDASIVSVNIYGNGGVIADLFPDYTSLIVNVAAGVKSWTSGVLGAGRWVFGVRSVNAVGEEPNTTVLADVRVDGSGHKIVDAPPTPALSATPTANGKVSLAAAVLPNITMGAAVTAKFFTNDGAGGAVDYNAAIATITLLDLDAFLHATFDAGPYGATARKFGCRAYNAGGLPSLDAVEATVTPVVVSMPDPLSPAASTGRV